MNKCKDCTKEMIGRVDKKFCDMYCKSAFYYKLSKLQEESVFSKVNNQLKLNRRILKNYNKSGKSTVIAATLLKEGFNPTYFTNYWRNHKKEVYFFVFEFGFLKLYERNELNMFRLYRKEIDGQSFRLLDQEIGYVTLKNIKKKILKRLKRSL